jgi:hypothetical protein
VQVYVSSQAFGCPFTHFSDWLNHLLQGPPRLCLSVGQLLLIEPLIAEFREIVSVEPPAEKESKFLGGPEKFLLRPLAPKIHDVAEHIKLHEFLTLVGFERFDVADLVNGPHNSVEQSWLVILQSFEVCFAEKLRVFLGHPYQVVFEPAENCPVHHVRVHPFRARKHLNLWQSRRSPAKEAWLAPVERLFGEVARDSRRHIQPGVKLG